MNEESLLVIACIAVGFIFVVAIWVAILNSEKKEIGEIEYNRKIKKPITVGVISIIICAICMISLSSGSPSSSNDDSNWSEEASIACQKRSDTYHKCSWSVIEDRCVCKER